MMSYFCLAAVFASPGNSRLSLKVKFGIYIFFFFLKKKQQETNSSHKSVAQTNPYYHLKVSKVKSLSLSDSLRPHGLQSTTLLRQWDFLGKSTRVGCHFLQPKNMLWDFTCQMINIQQGKLQYPPQIPVRTVTTLITLGKRLFCNPYKGRTKSSRK